MKQWRLFLFLVIAGAMLIAVWGYREATRDPVVRTAYIDVADWPRAARPVRAVLLSDLHVAAPDMPPERLGRIVAQVNALKPDIVLIAGDLVSDKLLATRHYSAAEAVAPLAGLDAPLGTVAVLGNHDHWRDAAGFREAVPQADITLLRNTAVKRGPLVIGGVDDDVTDNSDITATFAAMDAQPGPRILLSHSPDVVPALPHRVSLVMAGHTHCGQINLPIIGRLATASRYGERFACGLINDQGQKLVVSAGLGTSILPIRLGVPPDLWVVTFGPLRN